MTNNDNTITIKGGHRPNSSPCFILTIDRSDPSSAVLQEVERRDGICFRDDHADTRNVVRAAMDIAARRGVKMIQFTDWSYILCPKRIHLADLSMLTTGKTWYESILPHLRCVSPEGEDLEHYRHLARTNTWRQVGHGLIDIDLTNSRNGTSIDIDAPGSAMEVLNSMKKDRGFCEFLALNMRKLLERSGIHSLKGTEWETPTTTATSGSPDRRVTRRRTHTGRRITYRR